MKFVSCVVILTLIYAATTVRAQESLKVGIWGGKGIQLTVTTKGTTIDYGCDSGTIGKLQADANGKFRAGGTHVFGRGGPRNSGETRPTVHRAQYEGVLNGEKLELGVLLPELNRNLGKFTLQFGQRPVLERCG